MLRHLIRDYYKYEVNGLESRYQSHLINNLYDYQELDAYTGEQLIHCHPKTTLLARLAGHSEGNFDGFFGGIC